MSHSLPRPESFLRKVDKMTLPEMIFEDERYRGALTELSPVLNSLLEPLRVIANEL